jgi:hypothetical protein
VDSSPHRSETPGLDLLPSVSAALAKTYEEQRRTEGVGVPQRYVYASAWRSCEERMKLDVAYGHELPPWPLEAIARMTRGSEREVDVRRRLEQAGKLADPPFSVEGAQARFELRSRAGDRVVLVGKIDGALVWKIDGQRIVVPFDIKHLAQHLAERVNTIEDFFTNKWTAHIPYQMMVYLLGSGSPVGCVVLDRPGLPRIIPISLYDHMERAEAFWTSAEWATQQALRTRNNREHATDTAYTPELPEHRYCGDYATCQMCPHYLRFCDPPLGSLKMEMVLDDELLQAEQDYRENVEAAKIKERAETILKSYVKERELDRAVIGKSIITRSIGTTTSYEIPAEIKATYAKKVPRITVKIDCETENRKAEMEAI